MNRGTLWIVLLSVCALAVAGCGGSSHRVTITTAPTTLTAGTSSNVIAIDSHDSSDQINWTCAPTGACGSFNPAQTPNGTPSSYTAPAVAPSGGSVMITATSMDHPSRSDTVSIAITAVQAANFVFSLTGEESDSGFVYSLAGVVAIAQDGSGNVLGGEQDYNDGAGNTSPATGDSIMGGTLVMANDGSGNATLTITTNNTDLPNGGTEVFALAFANPNHALIVQFDGSATSSGSYDFQISTAAPVGAPSASFSFTASGVNQNGDPVCDGGVFSVDASGNITGIFDLNDSDSTPTATFANPIPAGVTTGLVDSFGRGVVDGFLFGGASINYYVVGPEVLRLIATDPTATAIGSAYGQGAAAGTFSSASLGPSVFQIGSSADIYGAVGEFSTGPEATVVKARTHANTPVRETGTTCTGTGLCSFSGEGDYNDLNTGAGGGPDQISGSYSIATTGYGSLNIDDGDLGPVVTFGVYAVDPALNILDPNNTTDTADSGGALIAEMDANLFGTGSIVPQTDVTQTSFSGFYAFGGQGDGNQGSEGNNEFDFLGTGTVTPGDSNSTFVGEGALSDPFGVLTDGGEGTVTYSATPSLPDADGRYSINPLVVETGPDTTANLSDVAVYQASGGQLYWVETEEGTYFLGALEQGTAPASDARKAQAKSSVKKH
jgi:hypothetical protein